VTIWIDAPAWPAHGRLWSHLISDTSFEELHAFAAANGLPRRGFEGDHYDVPDDRYAALLAAGARAADGREIVRMLQVSGLRIPKRRHERVLHSERYFGGVRRTFTLPVEIDEDASTAKYENGVLELTLAKKAAQAGRKLTIQ
jgi:hypothetical protein